MPKKPGGSALALTAFLALAGALTQVGAVVAQDVRPLGPDLAPSGPTASRPDEEQSGSIPLPLAGSRAATAALAQAGVASVLPPVWRTTADRYQPLWDVVGSSVGFGIERWGSYFAAAGIVPHLTPHPFLSPWGMLSYEGWLFDRYRAAWLDAPTSDDLIAQAAVWLQSGDRAMAEGRPEEAALAYRQVTQSEPELPLGWLALGAALAEMGQDAEAGRSFRQGLDRYPAWLTPALDWEALYSGADRLVAVQSASVERASSGSPEARFVAGVLHLYGGAPATGRRFLSGLEGDPHAAMLLARSAR